MTGVKDQIYTPNPDATRIYNRLFALYRDLHDAFGQTKRTPDLHHVMKELLAIRESARQA